MPISTGGKWGIAVAVIVVVFSTVFFPTYFTLVNKKPTVKCKAGEGIQTDGTCAACAVGTYSSSNMCKNCATGTSQPSQSSTSCLACETGTFQSKTGQAACMACETGTFQSKTGQAACMACTASCPVSSFVKTACSATTDTACSSCAKCSPGQILTTMCTSATDPTKCADCAKGTYQADSTYATSCAACAVNTFSDKTKATACSACTTPACSKATVPVPCHPTANSHCGPAPWSCLNGKWALSLTMNSAPTALGTFTVTLTDYVEASKTATFALDCTPGDGCLKPFVVSKSSLVVLDQGKSSLDFTVTVNGAVIPFTLSGTIPADKCRDVSKCAACAAAVLVFKDVDDQNSAMMTRVPNK